MLLLLFVNHNIFVLGTSSAFSDGMSYGWTAPIVPVLKSEDSPIRITEHEEGWLEQLYLTGGIAGLPLTIFFVDRIGRKGTLMCAGVISMTGWILKAVAYRIEFLYVARFLVGLAADVGFVATPMYVAEISDKKIRGFLAGFIQLMNLIGLLMVYAVGPIVPIYVSSIMGCVILTFQLISFQFIPESPYYLLIKGQHDKAKHALQKLRSSENVDEELSDITKAVIRQQSERGRPQDLVLIKSNRKAVIIMTFINGAQHFASISVMIMNLHTILEHGNSAYLQPLPTGILFAAIMLAAASVSGFFIDRFGRKALVISSSLMTGLSLLVLAVFFTLMRVMDTTSISWLPIVSVMFYSAVFRFGLGMVPIVLTSELFPAKVKALGMTFSDAMYLVFAMISVQVYQQLSELCGYDVPFYIFALSCVLTALFCWWYIPETKGKTLEEIQFILKGEPYPHSVNDVNKEKVPI